MALSETRQDVYDWFTTVLIPAAQPFLRNEWETNPDRARKLAILGQFPKKTGYLEDAVGAVETFLPSMEHDWRLKHTEDVQLYDDPWTTLPTVDAEGNDLDLGVPKAGDPTDPASWETEPITDAGIVYVRGVPLPQPGEVLEASWQQAWKRFGFNVSVGGGQIIDGCPLPNNGRWGNSIVLGTRENDIEFAITIRCQTRRIDQAVTTDEYHEEWRYETVWDKATGTWSSVIDDVDAFTETYHGPTVPTVV